MFEHIANTQLLLNLAGHGVSILVTIGVGALVLIRGSRKLIHVTFFFLNLSVGGFSLMVASSNLTGDADIARIIWTFNVGVIFVGLMFAHWVFLNINQAERQKPFLIGAYLSGLLILFVTALFPFAFVPSAEPKLYFNHYANPGPIYYFMFAHFYIVSFYAFVFLVRAYLKARGVIRSRLGFVIMGSIVGHILGFWSFPLIWDVPVDPFPSAFLAAYPAIFAYAVYKYRLMNIESFIRRALVYAVSVGVLSWAILFLGFINDWVTTHVPGIQSWVLPVIASLIAVYIGRLFWLKSIEAEKLKFEFITIAAHNLRTPLTRVKFAITELIEKRKTSDTPPNIEEQKLLDHIFDDSDHLIDITGRLLSSTEHAGTVAAYKLQSVDLAKVTEEVLRGFEEYQIPQKRLQLVRDFEETMPPVWADTRQLTTVIEMLVNNAVAYTPEEGTITVELRAANNNAHLRVIDTGIGISKQDLPYIFTKFFRTKEAMHARTESIGISLSLAKSIVERLNGSLKVHSEGSGKGSTFTLTLPLAGE